MRYYLKDLNLTHSEDSGVPSSQPPILVLVDVTSTTVASTICFLKQARSRSLLTAAFNPILIQEWVIHQSFFVPYTLLPLRDGKPLFREGVISKMCN